MFAEVRKYVEMKKGMFTKLLTTKLDGGDPFAPVICNPDGSCPLPAGTFTVDYTPFPDSVGVDKDGLAHITVDTSFG